MAEPNAASGARYTSIARQVNVPFAERGVDEETLEIRAIEVTGSNIGDAPMLPDLLGQIAPDQDIGSVTGDGAYDTRKCHGAIAARNAHAVIPPRKNAKLWKPDTPWGQGTKRSSTILKVSGPRIVAAVNRIPPPKPRRNQNALCETAGSTRIR